MPGASSKLNRVGGRLVSKRSKTGSPLCSAAMSAWVRSRHGGPAATAEVFKVLAKCRAMARQNKRATLQQQAGKLAEGRGTWQRSEQASRLLAQRKAVPAPAKPPSSTPKTSGSEGKAPPRADVKALAAAHRPRLRRAGGAGPVRPGRAGRRDRRVRAQAGARPRGDLLI